jgi:hypothetical protein
VTFQEMIDEVLQDSFSTQRYTTRVKRWLNEAQNKFTRQVDLPLSAGVPFTLAAGVANWGLPANFVRLQAVFVLGRTPSATSGDDATQLKPIANRNDYPAVLPSGRPTRYFLSGPAGGGGLWFTPRPDVSYDLNLASGGCLRRSSTRTSRRRCRPTITTRS